MSQLDLTQPLEAGGIDISDYGVGGRGGPDPPLSADEAVQLLAKWRADEYGLVRVKILTRCYALGAVHADDLRDLGVQSANVIGAAFRALSKSGFLRPTTHRASRAPAAHGRRSYVYVLTVKGERIASML